MRGILLILIIALVLAGCSQTYVCPDGSIVKDTTECIAEEPKVEEKEPILIAEEVSELYNSPYSFIVSLEGFELLQTYSLDSDRISDMSEAKLKEIGFEDGYFIEYGKETPYEKNIKQSVFLLGQEEDAALLFYEKFNSYKDLYSPSLFENKHDFDELAYFEYEDEISVNYHFLIKSKNVVTSFSMSTAKGKTMSDSELSTYIGKYSTLVTNHDENVSLPNEIIIPERITYGTSPYKFRIGSARGKDNGVAAGLIDFTFEERGDDWGTLRTVTIVIDNREASYLYPYVRITIASPTSELSKSHSKTVEVGEYVKTGQYMIAEIDVDLSFDKITEQKSLSFSIGKSAYRFDGIVDFTGLTRFSK